LRRPALHLQSYLTERLQKLGPPLTRDVVAERDLPVPMPDGVVLLADRYAPRGGGDRLPVALARCPYGRRGLISGMVTPLAERGYQVVIQSCRGTFGSGGTFEAAGPALRDGRGGLAGLRVLAAAWLLAAAVLPPARRGPGHHACGPGRR
jgi:predicted acyl esterase